MDAVVEYKRLYNKADHFVREVAEFQDNVIIPAINQLRYTGHHFMDAVDEDGQVSDMSELSNALGP